MNAPDTPQLGKVERAMCQKHLDLLVEEQADIVGALVCTVDGFELAARLRDPLQPNTLAAMSSSQLALGHALCAESGVGACRNVVVEADGGRVLMLSIPGRGASLLLTALCAGNGTLGNALWAVRRCAEDIAARLDASAA